MFTDNLMELNKINKLVHYINVVSQLRKQQKIIHLKLEWFVTVISVRMKNLTPSNFFNSASGGSDY